MKTMHCLFAAFSIAAFSPAVEPAALDVHEWGTFTVVSGSDGTPLRWWQALPPAAGELPSFVESLGQQKALPWFMRMETPVLYFYPDTPMAVEVAAEMRYGRITEWFPHPASKLLASGGSPFPENQSHRVTWKGRLLPPSDAAAASRMPKVESAQGQAYAEARNVPDAWFIQSAAEQTEKFIFYRGAGNGLPPWQGRVGAEGAVELASIGAKAAPHAAFVVETRAGKTRWSRMRPSGLGFDSVKVGESTAAPADLGPAMVEALAAAGLTRPEAEAMVATWSGHWFSETGTRVLAILPQAWVDGVLPLTVTPAPRKTVRVFVARFEVLTPERENALLTLLDDSKAEPASYANLELGRFASAALQRAEQLMTQRLHKRFAELSAEGAQ